MKAKQKPASASRKRPAAHAAKPAKTAAAEKAAPVAAARDKAHGKSAPAHKKSSGSGATPTPASEAGARHAGHKDGPSNAAHAAEKRPLGLEPRAPVMPEDRQSKLKSLTA